VTAAMFGIDVNFLQVKVNEGALLPTVTLQAGVQQGYETDLTTYRPLAPRRSLSSCSHIPGRRRILADPPVQGNPGAAAS